MKIQKIVFVFVIALFSIAACNTDTKKEAAKEVVAPNPQKIAFNISGMTCEIGCAKTIQSKLSKKTGITSAKVIFKDSIGLVEFDANTISADDISSFVDGIAGGGMYKVISTKTVASFEEVSK